MNIQRQIINLLPGYWEKVYAQSGREKKLILDASPSFDPDKNFICLTNGGNIGKQAVCKQRWL